MPEILRYIPDEDGIMHESRELVSDEALMSLYFLTKAKWAFSESSSKSPYDVLMTDYEKEMT